MDFHNRIALVTGGSSGIGHATALRLAELGADVALSYGRNAQAGQELAERIKKLGRRAIAVHSDMLKPEEVLALVDSTEAQLGPIDILISNAGMGTRKPLEDITLEDWDQTIDANLRATFLLAQRVVPGMRDRGFGRIVFVSSVAAFTGGVVGPHYAASKAGMLGLMHWLATSLAPYGITVNAVAPALISETGMIAAGSDIERELIPRIPVGRLGKPEDVADAIVMLAANSYTTNQTLLIDGGMYPH